MRNFIPSKAERIIGIIIGLSIVAFGILAGII